MDVKTLLEDNPLMVKEALKNYQKKEAHLINEVKDRLFGSVSDESLDCIVSYINEANSIIKMLSFMQDNYISFIESYYPSELDLEFIEVGKKYYHMEIMEMGYPNFTEQDIARVLFKRIRTLTKQRNEQTSRHNTIKK